MNEEAKKGNVEAISFSQFLEEPSHPGEATQPDVENQKSIRADDDVDDNDPSKSENDRLGDPESHKESADDGDDDESPELDFEDEQIQRITDPEAKKVVADLKRGVTKLVERSKAKEAELKKIEQEYQQTISWSMALADKDHYKSAIRQLIEGVAKHHGVTAEELMGGLDPAIKPTEQSRKFEYETDEQVYKAAREDALKDAVKYFEEKYGISDLASDRQARTKESQVERQVSEAFERTSKKIAAKEAGFKLTKDQFRRAIENNPGIDPEKAVRLEFYEDLKKHHSQIVARSANKAPEITDPVQRRERPKVSAVAARFSDFLD